MMFLYQNVSRLIIEENQEHFTENSNGIFPYTNLQIVWLKRLTFTIAACNYRQIDSI